MLLWAHIEIYIIHGPIVLAGLGCDNYHHWPNSADGIDNLHNDSVIVAIGGT